RPVRQVAAVAMEVDEARAWLGGTHDPRAQALAVRGVDGDRLERHAEIARRLRLAGKRKEGEPRLDPPHQQRQREERDDESTQQGHQAAPRHTWPSTFAAASADTSTSWTSKSTRSLQFAIHASSRARSSACMTCQQRVSVVSTQLPT